MRAASFDAEGKYEKFWPAGDDLYTDYPRRCVRITLLPLVSFRTHAQLITSAAVFTVRLHVHARDGISMEKDIEYPLSQHLLDVRQELILYIENRFPNPLTRSWLTDQGFSPV
jgi:hypothetical protein